MPLSEAQILEHLSRTDLFQFFPFTYAFFRAHHLPQAVVTVNPASFRQMAERLAFDKVVDAIVVSGEERTIDKGVLCELALQRREMPFPNEHAPLVDNKQSNLADWAARGGPGYLYTTDETFERDTAGGVDRLASVLR